jgi:NitT/TauT family transport system substrate-binding protein
LAEAKERFKVGPGMDSIYGSMDIGNKFNLDNAVYKISQKPAKYLFPDIVLGLK